MGSLRGARLSSGLVVGGAVVMLLATSCNVDEKIAEEELDRMSIPEGFESRGEGSTDQFIFRAYLAPAKVAQRHGVRPPSDSYERQVPLPDEIWPGWTPLGIWRGPSADRNRECLVAIEQANDVDAVDIELAEAERDRVESGALALVRIRASCGPTQHSFD